MRHFLMAMFFVVTSIVVSVGITLFLSGCSSTDYHGDDGRRFAPSPVSHFFGHQGRTPEDLRDILPEPFHVAALHGPICFSPDEHCDTELGIFMATAKKSLDIAVYDINRPTLLLQIVAKHTVMPVRVVVDKVQSKGAHSKVGELVAAGVQVRYGKQPGGIMHDKFTIVDSEAVETGSFNYTNHASLQNQENQFYTEDPAIVERYVQRFQKMWDAGTPVAEPPVTTNKRSPF